MLVMWEGGPLQSFDSQILALNYKSWETPDFDHLASHQEETGIQNLHSNKKPTVSFLS